MAENIYEITSLQEALKTEIKQKGLNLRRVCLSCDINASYFSRVLKGQGYLSSSQLFRILKFLSLSSDVCDYLFLLWHFDQAQEKSEKEFFQKKIRDMQNEKTKVADRIEAKVVKSAQQLEKDIQSYYSEATTALVHMMLTIDKYARQPHLIATALDISEKKLNSELTKLVQMGLIESKKDGYKVKDENIHLPEESPLSIQNHINWRLDVLKNLSQRDPNFSDYHFSAAFTCDEEAKLKIKALLKQILLDAQKIVRQSQPSNLNRLLIDLF